MSKKVIHKHYHHIDNGGISFELFDSTPNEEGVFPWITFSESFCGYATGSLTVHNQSSDFIRKFGEQLIIAANKLDEYSKEKAEING